MFVPAGIALMTEWTPYFTTVEHNRLDDAIKYFKPDFVWNFEIKKISLNCRALRAFSFSAITAMFKLADAVMVIPI